MCIRDRDVMNAYGIIVDFKNNVLRIGGEEVMLSTMTTAEKSMDIINQVAVTVPPNSEKIIMVRTEVDTTGPIFEPQVVSTPGTVSYTHLDVYKRQGTRGMGLMPEGS